MSSYDFYIMLRGLDELLARLMPLLIVAAIGVTAVVLLRLWIRRQLPGEDRSGDLRTRMTDAERRIAAIEARLPPPAPPPR